MNSNHGLAMIQSHFIVAAEAPRFVEPTKCGFNNPALRKDLYDNPGPRSFSLSKDTRAYFSIDGGNTEIAFFNQYPTKDFGDWWDGVFPADGIGNSVPLVQDGCSY